jgi:hypothetical protein
MLYMSEECCHSSIEALGWVLVSGVHLLSGNKRINIDRVEIHIRTCGE